MQCISYGYVTIHPNHWLVKHIGIHHIIFSTYIQTVLKCQEIQVLQLSMTFWTRFFCEFNNNELYTYFRVICFNNKSKKKAWFGPKTGRTVFLIYLYISIYKISISMTISGQLIHIQSDIPNLYGLFIWQQTVGPYYSWHVRRSRAENREKFPRNLHKRCRRKILCGQ